MSTSPEKCFCQVVYFSSVRTQNWMEQFHRVALKYATELGRVLTRFNFCPKHNRTRCPSLRYIKRNHERLTKGFSDGAYKGITFYSEDEGVFWSPFYLSLETREPLLLRIPGIEDITVHYNYGTVLMRYASKLLKGCTAEVDISRDFLRDIESIAEPVYGAVTVMPQEKDPCSYFREHVGTPHLTPEEDHEMKAYHREGHRFQTIMRDIYWGNVITRSHWGNDKAKEQYLLKALENECRGNVHWIDENTLFFCAPFAICPQDDPKILDFKKRLYKVLDECEIEVIGAHLDNYPEPQSEPIISNLLQENTNKKAIKLRSKKKLIIRYHIKKGSQETKEHECISDILKQAGPLPLVIKSEKARDGLLGEIEVSGSKVLKVRKAIIHCIKKMNMAFEVNPPIDDEDSFEDIDFTVLQ